MSLPVGSKAPAFSLPSSNGGIFSFPADAKGKALIIYFYPKDFTSGCTAESCGFRDQFDVFEAQQIKVVGISHDDLATHKRFIEAYNLPFELLSDPDRKVISLYKAKFHLLPLTKRLTYLINAKGVIVNSYEGLFNGKAHVQEMLKPELLNRL
jgi:peroxiredoxin Q/BCP